MNAPTKSCISATIVEVQLSGIYSVFWHVPLVRGEERYCNLNNVGRNPVTSMQPRPRRPWSGGPARVFEWVPAQQENCLIDLNCRTRRLETRSSCPSFFTSTSLKPKAKIIMIRSRPGCARGEDNRGGDVQSRGKSHCPTSACR